MSRFTPCRATDLQGVVRDCAGKCMNRGVRSSCPCAETLVYGSNILKDPSFGNGGGGPGGSEIPESNGLLGGSGASGKMVWSDGSSAPLASPWCTESATGRTKNWNYVGGAAVYVKATSGGENLQQAQHLYPVGLTRCEDVPPGYKTTPLSGLCVPGDLVTFSVVVAFSGTVSSPTAQIDIIFLDTDFTFGSVSSSAFLTIPGTISHSAVCPADGYYFRCAFKPSYGGTGTSTATITVDNGVLELV